jgi:hypothetical protein
MIEKAFAARQWYRFSRPGMERTHAALHQKHSLVEQLIAIAIIGVLAQLTLPVYEADQMD